MIRLGRWCSVVLLAASLLLAMSCAVAPSSESPRFYLLNSIKSNNPLDLQQPLRLAVGPVAVADYLDQPRIVIRTGSNELRLRDNERWATPLATQISHALRDSLADSLPEATTGLYLSTAAVPHDYQLIVEIERFDGALGSDVELVAHWQAVSAGQRDRVLTAGTQRLLRSSTDASLQSLINVQAQLLNQLGQIIAQAMVDALL